MLCFLKAVILVSSFLMVVKCNWIRRESNFKTVTCRKDVPINGSGKYVLQFDENCEEYDIEFGLKLRTSILNLNAAIQYRENATKSHLFEEQKRTLTIKIYERTAYDNGNDVLLKNWQVPNTDESTSWNSENYLSRTSNVIVKILSEDWTDHHLIFSYDEIPYNTIEKSFSDDSGAIQSAINYRGQYRPNTVFLYRLNEGQILDRDGIIITLDYLHVDIAMGEYMIIGAGTKPFKGPKPLFLTQPAANSTYFVHDASAYIILVSSSTQEKRFDGFKLHWKHTGTKESKDDSTTEDPLDALKSREICFHNVSSEDCNPTNKDGIFKKFRETFLETAINYTKSTRHKEREKFEKINASSVILHHIGDCLKTSLVKAIVQIKYKGKSLLTWRQLGDVITIIEKNYPEFFIQTCPGSLRNDDGNWGFFIYLSVPVFSLFFLTIWAWRQNIFQQCFTRQTEKELLARKSIIAAESNFYVSTATIPKLIETNERGRRRTLIAQNSNPSSEEQNGHNNVNMTDVSSLPSTSEYHKGIDLSFPRNKRRPSIQSLLDENELNQMKSHIHKIKVNEAEHLYNSVSSGKIIDDTKL